MHFGIESERRICKSVWWTLQSEAKSVDLMSIKMCGIQLNSIEPQSNENCVWQLNTLTHCGQRVLNRNQNYKKKIVLLVSLTFLRVCVCIISPLSFFFRFELSLWGYTHGTNSNASIDIIYIYRNWVCFGFGFSTIEFPCEWTFVVFFGCRLVNVDVEMKSLKWWWDWIIPVASISFLQFSNFLSTNRQFNLSKLSKFSSILHSSYSHCCMMIFSTIDNRNSLYLPYAHTEIIIIV